MNDLIPAETPNIKITRKGLLVEHDLDFEQWQQLGEQIGRVARLSLLLVGDWLNYGQDRWNGGRRFERMNDELRGRYERAMQLTGLELATLQAASQVARRIPYEDRSAELTFTHHRLLSRIQDEHTRRDWIRRCEQEQVSTRRLRASINAGALLEEGELEQQPKGRGKKTHLYWINRLMAWWNQARQSEEFSQMHPDEFEAVVRDFEPVMEVVEQLREKARSHPQPVPASAMSARENPQGSVPG